MSHSASTAIIDVSVLSRAGSEHARSATLIPPPARRWRTRIALPATLGVATLAMLAYAARQSLTSAVEVRVVPVMYKAVAGAPPVPISASPASGKAAVVQAPGWVEADPFSINVSALADGVVETLSVLEGQRVEKNQVVAGLIDRDAKYALESAESLLTEANANLAAAQTNWDQPIEHKLAVAVAEARLAENRAEIQKLDAQTSSESARTDELRDMVKRREAAVASGAVTEAELVQLKLRLTAQELTTEALRKSRPVLDAKVREAQAQSDAAKERLTLRTEDRRALALAHAAVRKATVARDEAALRLERMSVRSPIAGVVQARLVEPGSRLMVNGNNPGDSYVLRVYDPARLQARVDIPLADGAKVGVGHTAEITTETLPGRTFKGVVTRIIYEANIQKNTVQVKVAIEDPAPELRPELLCKVRFFGPPAPRATGGVGGLPTSAGASDSPAGSSVPRLLVPRSALFDFANDKASVYIVDQARGVAVRRLLSLGSASEGEWVEAIEGVRHGDRVVVSDRSRLSDGTSVHAIEGDVLPTDPANHGAHP